MSSWPKLLIVLLVCFVPCLSIAQKKVVNIRVVQEDSSYSLDQTQRRITLKNKSFKIQVLLQDIRGLYAYASFEDRLESLPDEMPVPDFGALPGRLMNEEEFNKEKELFVNNDKWCYWSFDPRLGFNRKLVMLDSGRVVGIKTIKQVYLPETGRSIKLKDLHVPLYLFFVAVDESDSDGKPVRELIRRKLRIDWLEED